MWPSSSPHGLFPATSGKRLFGPMFQVLLWTLASSMRPVVDWCTVTGCIRTHSYTRHLDGVISRLLSCVGRAMAIARLTHLRISIPASGAPPGHVPAYCFPGGAPRRNRPGSLRATFADDVSMPAVGSPTVGSPVLEDPAPLVSLIVVKDVLIPEGEMYGPSDVFLDAIPPPSGIPPFSWPIASECVAVERFGSSLGDGALPDVIVSNSYVEPPSRRLPRIRVQRLLIRQTKGSWNLLWWTSVRIRCRTSFDLWLYCQPWNSSSRRIGCGRRRQPSTIVARPQYPGGGWHERAHSWRSNLPSRSAHWGLVAHLWLWHAFGGVWTASASSGVPQSACLLEMGAGRWVDLLSRDGANATAVQLQRDVGLMQTNLDVLDQYSLALQGTASKLIEVCLGARQWQKWWRVLSVLASDVLPYRWRRWDCGGLQWIRCGSVSGLLYLDWFSYDLYYICILLCSLASLW